jgi:hypothetical protein
MAYTTLADVKTYLGISESTDDTLLTALITAAQKILEMEIGQIFEAASNTNRYFDAVADVEDRTLYFDRVCAAINSVTNGDGNEVTSSEYVTEPRNDAPFYAVTLKGSSTVTWTYSTTPENAITVSGKWAWTASAPADIVQATKRLAGYLYSIKDAQTFDVTAVAELGGMLIPKGLPADVFAIVRYWRNETRRIVR